MTMTTSIELLNARAFLRRCFPDGGKILCAVSGGMDSMCLLHFVMRQPGFEVTAAHFNHQLRPCTADRDETFVRDWCAARDIPFVSGRGNVMKYAREKGLSLEEAARELRYAFLRDAAQRGGFDAIFTAHHADDNAETMLLNLVRGTGSAGLVGIPQIRDNVYRPFLRTERAKLEAYAEGNRIPHVEDETNQEMDFARNVLRHRVLPVLKELNAGAVENMSHTAGILARESEGMERLAEDIVRQGVRTSDGIAVSCTVLLNVPLAVAERAVLLLLSVVAGQRKDLAAAHVDAVLELADRGRNDWELLLPYGMVARKENDTLHISRRERLGTKALLPGCPVQWGGYTLTLLDHREGEGLTLRKSAGPECEAVTIAACMPGERLTLPETHGGARTVKRLCLDRHISLAERERLPAIYVDGKLAAVWRLGTDVEFLPEGEICRFVQIKKETEEKKL